MPTIVHNVSLAEKRKRRVRGKLFGTEQRPRVTVLRSNQHTYLQAINDEVGVTIAAVNDGGKTPKFTGTKTERAVAAAKALAELLKKQKVAAVVFDRGPYRYHGRVRAVADALREAGVNL
jgi:large subunit ribosomal protein L18